MELLRLRQPALESQRSPDEERKYMYPSVSFLSIKIPTYGLMMFFALFISGALSLRHTIKKGLKWETTMVIIACIFGFAIIGASFLYFIVTYSSQEILQYLHDGTLFTERVGFVFYGGLILGFLGALLGMKLSGASFSEYAPAIIPYIPVAHAIGRIGCFLGGCCYGIPTRLPIGVVYPAYAITDVPKDIPLFPVQLLESVLLLAIFVILLIAQKKKYTANKLLGIYSVLYACCRFGLEFLRYDSIRGSFAKLSTSQWVSILLVISGIICFACDVRLPKRSLPGN